MSNFMGKVVGVTILNILKITRAMLMNFYIVNTPLSILKVSGSYFGAQSILLVSADLCL